MKDYVVESGPLRSMDALYDERFEKLRKVGDFHSIALTARAGTQRRVIAELNRATGREIRFVCAFFSPFAAGHRVIFGLRDVAGGKAGKLASALLKKGLKMQHLQYGIAEDDLVIVEMKDFAANLRFLAEYVPPNDGGSFYYLSAAPLEIHEIYWERAAQASLKAQEDRFRRDFAAMARESKFALFQDNDGSFTVILHPKGPAVEDVEKELEGAGQQAGIGITFAPGLFG